MLNEQRQREINRLTDLGFAAMYSAMMFMLFMIFLPVLLFALALGWVVDKWNRDRPI